LAPSHYAGKTPNYDYWILLDFLGFSRQNRDLSMGYAERTAEDISHALPRIESAGTRAGGLGMWMEPDCSLGKPTRISDSLQSIVALATSSAT
jgi:hypothetical protein